MSIVIYGASGALGTRVATELVGLDVPLVLGGRDPGKLDRVARRLGNPPVRTAGADDPESLRTLLEGARVVVNCAGPASLCGPPLIRAALAGRVHYSDASGEQAFIRRVFEEFGPEAERTGVALVPALGFDYALGDCLARLTAHGREPATEVVIAYAVAGPDVSENSLRFASAAPGGGEVVYRDGRWRRARAEVDRATFDFPPPLGRQQMGRYGSGEVVTVPRHTRTRTVTTLITAASLVPHPALLPWFPWIRPAVSLLRRTPLRRVLAAAGRMIPKTGTAKPGGESGTFTIASLVRGGDGSVARGLIRGGDFHRLTGIVLASGAARLARGEVHATGALPPAVAFDPRALLDSLVDHGLTWSVER
jgi:short subunit dehydrogenase-like uncharacterized protein